MISRGSFYQYFEDKTDILVVVLRRLRDRKLEVMAPVFSMRDDLGYFDFLKLAIKAGFQYAKKEPQALQVSGALFASKTLNVGALLTALGEEALDKMDSDLAHFYVKPIENSIARGEMTETYSPQFISAFTQTMLRAIGEVLTTKNISDPQGAKGEKLYDDFLNILKYGLYNRNAKGQGEEHVDD